LVLIVFLASLQNQSQKRSKAMLWQLAWFMAVLTYPTATLINRVLQCFRIVRQKGRQSTSLGYCIGGILGMHVETHAMLGEDDGVDFMPLFEARPEDVRSVVQKRDWFWIGRMVVLAALMTQSVATLVLSGRRLNAGELGEVDIRKRDDSPWWSSRPTHQHIHTPERNQRWEYIPGIVLPSMAARQPSDKDLETIATLFHVGFVSSQLMVLAISYQRHLHTCAQERKMMDEFITYPRTLTAMDMSSINSATTNRKLFTTYPRPRFGSFFSSFNLLAGLAGSSLSGAPKQTSC
jgi:hypothetical protein